MSAQSRRERADVRCWRQICEQAARNACITVEQAAAILKNEGRTARHHCGIVDAIAVVKRATGKRKPPPGRCRWVRDDGGRPNRTGGTGNCVPRAIAIATQKPYDEIRGALAAVTLRYAKTSRSYVAKWIRRNRSGHALDPEYGCWPEVYGPYLESIGWQFTSTEDRKVRLRADELPPGRLIVDVHRHTVAVIDGVIHDVFDSGEGGWRPVKGYYTAPN
jgi:hypothetical protein